MKILLDECVPLPIQRILVGHICTSVQSRGWRGFRNGDLISLAEGEFDLFLTSDQNIKYQQDLAGRNISILQLSTNRLRHIRAASQLIQTTVASMRPGEYRDLEIPAV